MPNTLQRLEADSKNKGQADKNPLLTALGLGIAGIVMSVTGNDTQNEVLEGLGGLMCCGSFIFIALSIAAFTKGITTGASVVTSGAGAAHLGADQANITAKKTKEAVMTQAGIAKDELPRYLENIGLPVQQIGNIISDPEIQNSEAMVSPVAVVDALNRAGISAELDPSMLPPATEEKIAEGIEEFSAEIEEGISEIQGRVQKEVEETQGKISELDIPEKMGDGVNSKIDHAAERAFGALDAVDSKVSGLESSGAIDGKKVEGSTGLGEQIRKGTTAAREHISDTSTSAKVAAGAAIAGATGLAAGTAAASKTTPTGKPSEEPSEKDDSPEENPSTNTHAEAGKTLEKGPDAELESEIEESEEEMTPSLSDDSTPTTSFEADADLVAWTGQLLDARVTSERKIILDSLPDKFSVVGKVTRKDRSTGRLPAHLNRGMSVHISHDDGGNAIVRIPPGDGEDISIGSRLSANIDGIGEWSSIHRCLVLNQAQE